MRVLVTVRTRLRVQRRLFLQPSWGAAFISTLLLELPAVFASADGATKAIEPKSSANVKNFFIIISPSENFYR
jgi:hypothetical protein